VGIGLVMTVRNEERLLRDNLLYHRRLGVESAWVFDDGSTDGTRASIEDLGFVRILGNAALDALPPELRTPVLDGPGVHARQCRNALAAFLGARDQGLDWLLHVDADEVVAPRLDRVEPGSLARILSGLPGDVGEALFTPLEVVQRDALLPRPLVQALLFKKRPEAIRLAMPDPLSGLTLQVRGNYGHSFGKTAFRVAAAQGPESSHRFHAAPGRQLASVNAGRLLHYHLYDTSDFVARLRKAGPSRDPVWERWASPCKLAWRRLAGDPAWTDDALADYYRRHVAFDDDRLRPLRRRGLLGLRGPAVVEVRCVRDALEGTQI